MRCINCGCELAEGSKFCFSCGAKQPEEIVIPKEDVEEVTVEPEEETQEVSEEPEEVAQEVSEEPEDAEESYEEPEEAPQEAPAKGFKFCPYCGAKNDEDAIFCCSCGRNMEGNAGVVVTSSTEEPFKPKKKFPVKAVVGVVAAVAVVGVAVKLVGGLFGSDEKSSMVAYLKNGRVNQIDVEHYKKGPVEYSGRYGREEVRNEGNASVVYSKDGKYVFYPTDYDWRDDESDFRLNMQKVGKTEEPIKIDNSVKRYSVLENNKVVYIKSGSDTLYINDKKDNKEKIASDVSSYRIDKKEENIVWLEQTRDGYNIYQQDLALKKDKKALLKDVQSFDIGKDMRQIVALQDDILYLVKDFGEKKKIASGVTDIFNNDEKDGCFYYVKEDQSEITAADIIEDDCAEADQAMKEPNREDFRVEKIEKNSWTGKYEKRETIDSEKYNEAYEKYYEKEERDSMRERLGEYKLSNAVRELYCYKDGKEKAVDKYYAGARSYGTDTDILVFNRYNMENVPKIKLSEVEYMNEIESKYLEAMMESMETCVYTGGKTVVLGEKLDHTFMVDTENKTGYGVKVEKEERGDDEDGNRYEEEATSTLLSFSVDAKADGKCKVVAEEIGDVELAKDGKIYYLTDMKDDGSGELYCNEDDIDSDVMQGTLYSEKDSEVVYYGVDCDRSKGRGTLKMYNGKDDVTIADDVFSYKVLGEKEIALLLDYNLERYRGELELYKGKDDLIDLDEDVTCIFGAKLLSY